VSHGSKFVVCVQWSNETTVVDLPVPLGVDLPEVDAVGDDAAAAGDEEHVAVGEPELVGQAADREQHQQVEPPGAQRRPSLLPPLLHHLPHQRTQQQVLRTNMHGEIRHVKQRLQMHAFKLRSARRAHEEEQEIDAYVPCIGLGLPRARTRAEEPWIIRWPSEITQC
jgi:hypothetical protein